METIQLSGYTSLEKMHIAMQYLIPKQLQSNGLSSDYLEVPEEVIHKIITSYTRESGVRNLERELGSVCRAKAVEFSEAKDSNDLAAYRARVELPDLETILGIERYDQELAERSNKPGVVTGLVAYSIGGTGAILFIESSFMPGSGRLQLTGKLGEVIKGMWLAGRVSLALHMLTRRNRERGGGADVGSGSLVRPRLDKPSGRGPHEEQEPARSLSCWCGSKGLCCLPFAPAPTHLKELGLRFECAGRPQRWHGVYGGPGIAIFRTESASDAGYDG